MIQKESSCTEEVYQADLIDVLATNIGFQVDSRLIKAAETDLDSLIELGRQALDAKQYIFARKIFCLAKRRGFKLADLYIGFIEKQG